MVVQEFRAYFGGTSIIVYLAADVTEKEGNVSLDCITASGTALTIPRFVSDVVP
jgi:hypothetical protein